MPTAPTTVPIAVADAFTSRPFGGNPAAVCLLESPAPETWMQDVAAELNLSETAFLVPAGRASDGLAFDLRWFTPTVEVDLCGHATLASVQVLADRGVVPPGGSVAFHTRSGELAARLDAEGIVLDFPAITAVAGPPPPGLLAALGLEPSQVVATGDAGHYTVVQVADAGVVHDLVPDPVALRDVEVLVVIVTAASGPGAITSRVFGPAIGIDEDPVTGAAHCLLGPWWAPQLGTEVIEAHQASARGGELQVRVLGDRVELVGRAVTVWTGAVVAP